MADSTTKLQPIKFFTHPPTPNPTKVNIFLEELNLPFEPIFIGLDQVKSSEYTRFNPNGRLPCIVDPNTGITIWESGAIIQYLIDTYDKDFKLSFSSFPEKYHCIQFLHFQMSGQGPYFGQVGWFTNYADPPQPLARERYLNELRRVTKVLDSCLTGKKYLVGGKCTFADLSFVPWYWSLERFDYDGKIGLRNELEQTCPNWKEWIYRLDEREMVKKVKAEAIAVLMRNKGKVSNEVRK